MADERDQPDHAIEDDGEERAGRLARRFLEQEVALDDVAAGAAGQELIVKHPDQEQPRDARNAQMNLLHLEQDLPADAGREFDHEVGNERGNDPAVIGHAQRDRHLRALVRIVKNPEEHRDRDRDLEDSDEDFFHSPKRSFQMADGAADFLHRFARAHFPDK